MGGVNGCRNPVWNVGRNCSREVCSMTDGRSCSREK